MRESSRPIVSLSSNYVHVTTMNPRLRVASKEGLLEDSPSADDKYIPRHKDKS